MRFRRLLIALALVSLVAPLALAQTRGSVSGVVRNPEGDPLPGVTVTISGEKLPLGRSMTTLSDGSFQFGGLIPGEYLVKAELPGLGSFEQNAIVSLGEETPVRPVLRVTATAAVEVSAATPLVDTKASDISQVTTSETLQKLPIGGSYAATFQLAPGVAENNSTAPNAGGGRQDNTFLYDGVNVTNPFFGDLFQNFTGVDIQEVAITRGGVSAEFGRTGGFVVNAITKSGSNTLHGGVSVEYSPIEWTADSTDPTIQRSKFERFRPGVQIGGPIFRDHLFFYGSANLFRVSEQERVNQFGSSPGNPVENSLPDAKTDTDEYFIKLTANPTSSILIDASYRYRDITSTNSGIGTRSQASVAQNGFTTDHVGVVSALWTITPTWSLDAKYNHNEDNNSIEPIVDLGYQPPFNAAAPYLSGLFTTSNTGGVNFVYAPAGDVSQVLGASDGAVNDQDYIRDEFRLTSSVLANFFGATHDIRFGATYSENREDLFRRANGWGSIIASTSSNCGPVSARPCFRARFNEQAVPQISDAETWGLFVQDQMTWNRLTLNLGVLFNRDEFIPNGGGNFTILRGDYTIPNANVPTCDAAPDGAPACTYLDTVTFDFADQIQPRVGLVYEIDPSAHDKFFANFARYSNMDNQSFARSAAPIRPVRVDAYFDRTTGALITRVIRDNQTGKRILENIDPTKTDEVIAGYARPFGSGWAVELWGMYRKIDDIIEDFPGVNRATASGFRYGNIPAYRRYRAATVEVRKAYSDKWTLDVSYTLSRLEGNWDLDIGTAQFYSSSYIEDGPGLYVEDDFRTGILIGDREHVAKLFASYELLTNTTIGGYLRYQSGRPWEARKFDAVNGVPYEYAEPAGSRRLGSWTNFDLQVTQRIPLRPVEIVAGVRIGNVFDSQPALTVDQVLYDGPSNATANPNFGKATSYAAPRRFTLVAGVTF
ncbi:MAG: TonB-dependent receptor [Acidobacteriota bacterium]|nr:TonB-dependent receptor [Acidobacteriota bacterium]MDQ5870679.1 TonB-dependent receptor [Acidobacteriota bacterium]